MQEKSHHSTHIPLSLQLAFPELLYDIFLPGKRIKICPFDHLFSVKVADTRMKSLLSDPDRTGGQEERRLVLTYLR